MRLGLMWTSKTAARWGSLRIRPIRPAGGALLGAALVLFLLLVPLRLPPG